MGVGGGQGSLACCSPWGCRVGHNWVNWTDMIHIWYGWEHSSHQHHCLAFRNCYECQIYVFVSISLCKWVPHLSIHMEAKYTHSAPFSPMLCGRHGVPHSDLPSGELSWGCSWWRAFSCHISRCAVASPQGRVQWLLPASDWTQCLAIPALGGAPLRSSSCFGALMGLAETFLQSSASGSSYPVLCLSFLLQVSDQ